MKPSGYTSVTCGLPSGMSFDETLGKVTKNHICRRCGAYDIEFLGYSRMRIQDGFGSVDLDRCDRCDGTGIDPQKFFWDGIWYKPWTWLRHHYDWEQERAK